MKTFVYIIAVFGVCFFSCKKQNNSGECGCGVPASPIYFAVLDKNGNNIIHSVNDTLLVTYVQNGVATSNRLDIIKAQVSATDATPVSKYNGFVVSDLIPNNPNFGYMASASGPGIYTPAYENYGIRNFNFYLNGINIGAVYFDYWESLNLGSSAASYPGFTLNGTPATITQLPGYLTPGYPAVLTILPAVNSGFSDHNNLYTPYTMYVLQYNGVITGGGN